MEITKQDIENLQTQKREAFEKGSLSINSCRTIENLIKNYDDLSQNKRDRIVDVYYKEKLIDTVKCDLIVLVTDFDIKSYKLLKENKVVAFIPYENTLIIKETHNS